MVVYSVGGCRGDEWSGDMLWLVWASVYTVGSSLASFIQTVTFVPPVSHPDIDSIHLTGSADTFNAIVWGGPNAPVRDPCDLTNLACEGPRGTLACEGETPHPCVIHLE